jgi:hypothetical protein
MQVDLGTINKNVKAIAPIVKAAAAGLSENENDFAWVDKFANLIDKVSQFAELYKNSQTPPITDRQIDTVIERAAPSQLPPPPPMPQPESKSMQAIRFVIPIIEQYLVRCIKENEKMPIGEVIAKLDIMTASEAYELLQKYKQGQGIK